MSSAAYWQVMNEGGEGYVPAAETSGALTFTAYNGGQIDRQEAEYLLAEESAALARAKKNAEYGDFSAAAAVPAIHARVQYYAEQLAA